VGDSDGDSGVPLAELIAALSLGTDLGLGQPMEHVVRECVLALGLAERLGLEERERHGRLDGDAVDVVLRAAGHESTRRTERPAGLTAREVEILRLLARGLLNKEIARRLEITPKTVGNHVEHIYAKIGVSSRAAAGLFATEHGLLAVEASAGNVAAFA
jgi:DNA-binding NarL/FixJ family response regulator